MALTTLLFRRMLAEEWRLHEELFGSRRFAAFPLVVAALSLGAFELLALTDVAFDAVVAGLHALVVFFGLQVGTIGLVGRDALRDVLGDVTLLVFAARTLPVSWTRLLAVFLVKDLVYYTAFVLVPVLLAATPSAVRRAVSPAGVGLLWLTVVGTFALGVALSLTLTGLATRSRPAVVVLVAVVTVAAVAFQFDPVAYTPYAVVRSPTAAAAVRGFGPLVVLGVVGPALFRPARGRAQRTRPDRFSRLRSLTGDERGLAVRALLDVARSSGSVWKVLFSMGVLFAVTALLLQQLTAATGIQPSPGIAFGTLLGLGAFTTYSWVTQFDDPAEYLRYPVSTGTVVAGKGRAYLLLSVPAGIGYLGLALWWYDAAALAVGVVLVPLVASYVFGVTVYVAGLSPTELLFDTPRFLAFGAALSVVAVPLLVAALAHPVAPTVTTLAAVGISAVAAVVGLALTWVAGPRWERRLRA